jgi:hypothetical protein
MTSARRVEEAPDQRHCHTLRVVAQLGGGDARRPLRRRPRVLVVTPLMQAVGHRAFNPGQRHPDVDVPDVPSRFEECTHRAKERGKVPGEDGVEHDAAASAGAARSDRVDDAAAEEVPRPIEVELKLRGVNGRVYSGDAAGYSYDREYEDVVAVLDAVGPPRFLFGHSSSAICALGAALMSEVEKLVIVEPPLPLEEPGIAPEHHSAVRAALERGEAEATVLLALRHALRLEPEAVDALHSPQGLAQAAPARDCVVA